jgi:hypothetical protein
MHEALRYATYKANRTAELERGMECYIYSKSVRAAGRQNDL